jgi:predicted phage terminase large subunit-like protein
VTPAAVSTQEQIIFKPQRGPQEKFLSSSADIVIYGGSAGGGKTWGLVYEGIRHKDNPNFGAVIFRRTCPQITNQGGLWDKSLEIYPLLGSTPREGYLDHKFPSGAKISFAHMQYEDDCRAWDGSEIPLVGYDQLESFTKKQFTYMLTRNRTTCGVDPYMRGTCNPVPKEDQTGGWLNRLLAWWIDQETGLAIPERSGVVRYFAVVDEEFVWADDFEQLRETYGRDCFPKSFTFIRSSVYDNKILLEKNPGYLAGLQAQSRVDRLRLLDGNWNARETPGELFKTHWIEIVDAAPILLHPFRYWDQAATKHSKSNPMATKGPSWTAGVRGGMAASGIFYITDVKRFQENPLGVEQATENTATQDGQQTVVIIEQDPGQAGKQNAQYYCRKLISKGFVARANPVHDSKLTRSKPLSAAAEAGCLKLVRGEWNEAFLNELANYDGGVTTNADQTDAASGLFNEATKAKSGGVWGRD